jgi:hypothetical protein
LIQSMPYSISWFSTLVLSYHLWVGLPCGLLPSGFPTKTMYVRILSPIRATCPTHFSLLDLITRRIFGEKYRAFSSFLCSLLHYFVTSSLLDQTIFLNILFWNISPTMWATKFHTHIKEVAEL